MGLQGALLTLEVLNYMYKVCITRGKAWERQATAEVLRAVDTLICVIDMYVDTHEQSSWYFITQASFALNPGALDARRTLVSSPFPPQLWRQNTLATKPHSLSNTAYVKRIY